MNELQTKSLIAIIVGVLSFMFNCLNGVVFILVILTITDYITGVAAAFVRGDLESRKALIGIFKKLGYFILFVLGLCLDYLAFYFSNSMGWKLPFNGYFGVTVCLSLIGTEGLSILENLHVLGVPLPKILKCGFKQIRVTSEDCKAIK